ncbi:MAG: acyltransferase [bacterium]|nr:acyltransferase [bacterium]
MLKKFIIVISDFIQFFIIYMPGTIGRKIRYLYYKNKFKACGKNVLIDQGVIIQGAKWISIGNNVWIDQYCILIAGVVDEKESARVFTKKGNPYYSGMGGELIIGNNVHIAPFCTIQAHGGTYIGNNVGIASGSRVYSLSHHYRNPKDRTDTFSYKFTPMAPKSEQSLISAPVVISDDCALGLNSVVLPGTTIKKGTWIGVSSFVAKDTEEDSIYMSRPARFIKRKFERNR